jgi:hypothetical protein
LLPFSAQGFEGPLAAGLPSPLRSARRVWLPSRRLTPFEPVPALFRTGGAPGIRPSELSPLARYPRVSTWKDPHAVFPAVVTVAKGNGPARQAAASGLWPSRESLATDTVLARRALAAPMGFALPGSSDRSLRRDRSRCPLTRFADAPESAPGGAPESQSAPVWFRPLTVASHTGGRNNPLRVFAPAQSHAFGQPPSGLCIHLGSRRALLSTNRPSLEAPTALPELLGPAWVPSPRTVQGINRNIAG